MTDPSPYAAPGAVPPAPAGAAPGAAPGAVPGAAPGAVPGAPVAPVVRTTTALLPVTVAVGTAAAVAAIVNAVFGAMFPGNAPVESIYNFGVTVDLVAIVITALIRALVLWRRERVAVVGARVSVWAILAAVFALVILAGWLLFGGAEYWGEGMQRYMSASSGAFYLGAPWVLSIVFAEIALRRKDTTLNSALAIGSLVVGGLVGVATVAAAVIYGLGLSA